MREYIKFFFASVAGSAFLFTGCQETYFDTMESLGKPRRELMVNRVVDARDAQQETAEQFEDALDKFIEVTNYSGGKLEDKYRTLKGEYEKSQKKADEVTERINKVEEVSQSLFEQWQDETEEYTSDLLRAKSIDQLKKTRAKYSEMMLAMRQAEEKMAPVLAAFKDQVLFLKHNLNAQAVAQLKNELTRIELDTQQLIKQMKKSIDEANKFIEEMKIE
jgi:hypothetical protein